MTSAIGKNAKASSGFTLIELIVVLAILVGLAAAFPMAMDRFQPDRQVHIYAQRVASDLRMLRADAMARNQVATFSAQPRSHRYQLQPPSTTTVLPEAISIALKSADPSAPAPPMLQFFPDGSSSGGIVQLQRGDHEARLRLDVFSGQVHVE